LRHSSFTHTAPTRTSSLSLHDALPIYFTVLKVDKKPYRRRPYAPFITSTLQQEASRKLRLSSAQTMRVAQRLYENGHITYMRTEDRKSTRLNSSHVKISYAVFCLKKKK